MSTTIEIINSKSISNSSYLEIYKSFELDIYYSTTFLEIDAKIQQGEYEIFIAKQDNSIFIYPYIKLYFESEKFNNYFDITSPYGYCGPYCNDTSFFDHAEQLFIEYTSQKAVSEFIRYHYIYNIDNKFTKNIHNLHNRNVIVLNTNQSFEQIWMTEFSSTNRNLIRKLEKEEFIFEITSSEVDTDSFVTMYYETMNNANASSFYYFERETLKQMIKDLGDNIVLARVSKNDINYCFGLFFLSGDISTYYLSARNLLFSKIPATNFLLSKIVNWLNEYRPQIKKLNYGGGLSLREDDYLYKFKSNFSKQSLPFFIGKRIHNNQIYEEIKKDWIIEHGLTEFEKRKHILHFYREN